MESQGAGIFVMGPEKGMALIERLPGVEWSCGWNRVRLFGITRPVADESQALTGQERCCDRKKGRTMRPFFMMRNW